MDSIINLFKNNLITKILPREDILMERKILANAQVHPDALTFIAQNYAPTINEIINSINVNKIVVIGMAKNPFVKKARKMLDDKKMAYTYLEYGGYLSKWKQRLAIKLWSGWASFPQVFIDGKLIGGSSDLEAFLKK